MSTIHENLSRRKSLSAAKRALLDKYLQSEVTPSTYAATIPRRPGGPVPLSFAQERLWFLEQFAPGSGVYHIPAALRLRGRLSVEELRRAFSEVVRRHEVLRTTLTLVEGRPMQIVEPPYEVAVPVVDLSHLPEKAREREAMRELLEQAGRPFDLEHGPLWRVGLWYLGHPREERTGTYDEYILLFVCHHIVFDGWSVQVLVRELAALYSAYRRGQPTRLPELSIQYADYATWQRQQREVIEQELSYWKGRLAGAPQALDLPTDRARPLEQSYRGATYHFTFPPSLTASLKQLSQRQSVTLFMLLLAAFKVLLHRHSGQRDLCVGTPVANRIPVETEGLIGCFVNTLVLRTVLSGNPPFTDFLAQVREVCLGAQAHQSLPFERLVDELQPVRDLSHSPLFQVLFALQNMAGQATQVPGLEISPLEAENPSAKFDLSLDIMEEAGLGAVLEYSTDLFDRDTIGRMAGHYRRLLAGIVASPGARLSELPLLTEVERRQLLTDWNATDAAYPQNKCVHQLFEAQVERTPEVCAVVCRDQQLTYRQLNARANCLAHALIAEGLVSDQIVAVLADRGIDLLAMMLGIYKAGGAYLPLDPQHPETRLAQVIALSRPSIVLTVARYASKALQVSDTMAQTSQEYCPAVLTLESCLEREWPETNPPLRSRPANLAYVIFTSGSTGMPKGAMIEHQGMLNNTWSKLRALDLTTEAVIAQTASQCFDISVWQFLTALVCGGRVHIFPDDVVYEPRRLLAAIDEAGVTVLEVVPSLMLGMIESESRVALPRLRWLLPTGEALPAEIARQWLRRFPSIPLMNAYGPAECSDDVAYFPFGQPLPDAAVSVPIGRPIDNLRLYILDPWRELVPIGVPGELCVAGVGVGRGYLRDAARTAEAFVPDPFSVEVGARIYRTGDLARYRPDGNIEFLGRVDHQVKVRGFRIELGEVEAALCHHPLVKEAVVMARGDSPGEQRLVGYVVGREHAPEVQALRAHLQGLLPEYMVPGVFVFLEALPRTPNGKVDRKALPVPDIEAQFAHQYVAPRNPTEEVLAHLWAEVLGLERVGIHDNFFGLGGHSLLAVTLIERMRRQGLQVDVRALFATPTLAGLATAVGSEHVVDVPPNRIPPQCEAITPEMLPLVALGQTEIDRIVGQVPGGVRNVQDIYPVAPLQEGILFHHLMIEDGDVYLEPTLLSFDTRARLEGFLGALQSVINRHDILRTALVWEGLPEPVQVVWREAPLSVEEVTFDADAGHTFEQLRARFDPRRYRLDVRQAPLLRGFMACDAVHERWLLLLLSHHLVTDHTTLEILVEEVQAHMRGEAHRLPAPRPFRNFVAQARWGVSPEEHAVFFREMLGDVDEPTAPFGLLDVQGDGSGVEEVSLDLEAGLARQLRARARTLGVSVASLCHLAFAQVLARVSGRKDVVFGTVLFGRLQGGEEADRVLGMFINTLPVRIKLGEEGVEEAVRRTHGLLGELLRHEHAALALAQRCSAVPAPAPLFSALFNYRYSREDGQAAPAEGASAWDGIEMLDSEERTNYPLSLDVDDLGEGFRLTAQVQSPIEPQRLCGYMHTALTGIIDALETAPDMPVQAIDVLPEAERRQLLIDWNATEAHYPQDQCIHQLFEAQVEHSPEATAVVYEDQALTYQALNTKANQLAHYLRALGVGPEVRVGICVERSLEMVVGILAILKAGGAYVPIDPVYPKERISYMLEDANPEVVLTQHALLESLPEHAKVLCLDTEWQSIACRSQRNLLNLTDPQNLAYVIYTSGSTGRPKGVGIAHANVLRLFAATEQEYRLNAEDVWTLFHSSAFDFSVWELWGALLYGGRVVVVPYWVSRCPESFHQLLRDQRVTVLNQTPSSFYQLDDADAMRNGADGLPLRLVIFGGEALEPGRLRGWFERYGERRPQLVNMYGITETTVHVTLRRLRLGDTEGHAGSGIGRPIEDLQAYLLDAQLSPVPVGVPGELYIGGAGLARGYLNRPDLTAERFIPNPFSGMRGARLYRTGDLARYRVDGNIEYLGRLDHQVKVRGFRIELGEIEATLVQHPEVREAVVVMRGDSPGEKRLVAYLVGQESVPTVEAVRTYLKGQLPEYMVPGLFVFLDALPLTPNGKVDRKSLPTPDSAGQLAHQYVAPRYPTEETLAGIWAEVLAVERVGIHDNFFALGGHSLLATQVMSRVRKSLDAELPLRALFESPTVAELAVMVEAARASEVRLKAPPLAAVSRAGDLPLSHAQQRLWFLDQLEPGGSAYNMPGALRLVGCLDRGAFDRTIHEVVRRHEVLRTRFVTVEGQPVQVIAPELRLSMPVVELRHLGESAREAEVRRLAAEEARRPFDLSTGPLLRVSLLDLGERKDTGESEHVVLFTLHHIVSDGWSEEILVREFVALYEAFAQENASPLPELAIQYADYAVWQRGWLAGEVLERQLEYWRGQLAGAPAVLELPTDRPRPSMQSYRGASYDFRVPKALTERLYALSQRAGATLFMTLLAAFKVLLYRYSGQRDLCVGTPIANRTRVEVEGLMGFFVNTLVLRTQLSGGLSFTELLGRVREVCLGAQAHQDLPFERLVEALQPVRDMSHSPLFQVMFTLQNVPTRERKVAGLCISAVETESRAVQFDLSVDVIEAEGGLEVRHEYCTDLFDASTIVRLASHYEKLLSEILNQPEARISELPLMPGHERHRLVHEWNATGESGPMSSVVELFEAQVMRHPEAVAVVFEGARMSYRELNARANRIAWGLKARGIGAESMVAIASERSLDLVLAVLGILKAGAAYLPLDPEQPRARWVQMIEDASPCAFLVAQQWLDRFLEKESDCISLNTMLTAFAGQSEEDPGTAIAADNLAYVLYTSGSTGRPKGAAITHRGLSNRVRWGIARFDWGPDDVILHRTALGFDVAAWELFGALAAGARLVIASCETGRDPQALVELIQLHGVTWLEVVPALLQTLLETPGFSACRTLRGIGCGGESLSPALLAQYRSLSSVPLYNLYGPTEATIDATLWECTEATNASTVPIGRPIRNTRIYILDCWLNPVPAGVVGELYIGGVGLARGYLYRAGLTAERLVPDPFGPAGGRLYRTGDLARYQPDGNIEFLGRIDHQVKLRGYRIELGEIEARLGAHPEVREVCVLLRQDPMEERRLVAYVVRRKTVTEDQLRSYLKEALPEYMIPAAFVFLEVLPRNVQGKIDRMALPKPEFAYTVCDGHIPPRTLTERMLAELWAEVLNLPEVGIHDNFFTLGGHSLMAVRLTQKIRERLHIDLSLVALFQAPTMAELALHIESEARVESTSAPLIFLRRGTVTPPLYCIHTGTGHARDYQPLVAALGDDRIVYGIQMPAFLNPAAPTRPMDSLAEEYAALLLMRSPGQPFFILGWSLGGLIALSVAAKLEQKGARIGFLGLLDTGELKQSYSSWIERFIPYLHDPVDRARAHGLSTSERQALDTELKSLPPEEQPAYVARWGQERGYWFNELSPELLRIESQLWRHTEVVEDSFALPQLDAPLHVWWARDSLDAEGQTPMDWSICTHQEVIEHVVDGDHGSIIRSPQLHHEIRQAIDTVAKLTSAEPSDIPARAPSLTGSRK